MLEKVQKLNNIFADYKILANCVDYHENNNYCFYNVQLKPRGKFKDLEKFANEISLGLRTFGKPSFSFSSQEGLIRLEFYNNQSKKINLLDIFSNRKLPSSNLFCLLGTDIKGDKLWFDLEQAPHVLIAGATGSGKSTLLHNIIANIFNYHNAKLFLMDPKNIEFYQYAEKIERDLQVSFDYKSCVNMLDKLISIMELRYSLLRSGNNIKSFPFIIIIIDEFADLILQDIDKHFYDRLCKLSQKCRAARMHIILGTQRPSVDVISGTIKANFPVRVACKTSSGIDSKVILDTVGAENLLGKGDAFIKINGDSLKRFQIAYTDANEVCKYFGK